MNHGANLTLMEMDTRAKVDEAAARARRARRRQIAGPRSGEDVSVYPNRISRLVNVHAFELAASLVALVVIGGGIASAALLV